MIFNVNKKQTHFTNLFKLFFMATLLGALCGTSTSNAQVNTDPNTLNLEQREQAFRKRMHIATTDKITYKRVPSADEVREMIEKDPSLANKKNLKKTVEFSEFEKLMTKPDFRFVKMMRDTDITFIEYSQEEMQEKAKNIDSPIRVKVGEAFPNFSLDNTDGGTSNNEMFAGRLTLINFFFEKCAPCIEETPMLNEFSKKHPEVQVLGITFDNKKQVANYKKEHEFTWTVAYGAEAFIDKTLGIRAFPSYALIDGHGKVLAIGGQSELKINIKNLVKSLETLIQQTTNS